MLKELLKEHGLSLSEFTRRVQRTGYYVTRATLHTYKFAPHLPDYTPLGLLRAMAQVLGMTVPELLAIDDKFRNAE